MQFSVPGVSINVDRSRSSSRRSRRSGSHSHRRRGDCRTGGKDSADRFLRIGFFGESTLSFSVEKEAKEEGLHSLSTEASLISYKLFLKNKWEIIRKEKINIKNIIFERYKMIKNF